MSVDVSVIVPCFNSSSFIGETIESVLRDQPGVNLELILIDDGSTDNTLALIRDYKHQATILTQEHRGVSAARNKGTAAAQGKFIQYLDSDDLLEVNTLQERMSVLRHDRNEACHTNWSRFWQRDDGCKVTEEPISRSIEAIDPDPQVAAFTQFWVPPAAIMYTRTLVNKVGGWRESLPIVQDARFLWDAASAGARFVHINKPGALYRTGLKSSNSQSSRRAFVKDVFRNTIQVEKIWKQSDSLSDSRRGALIDSYGFVCRELLVADYRLYRASLRRIYSLEPAFRCTWPKITGVLSAVSGPGVAARIMRCIGRPMTPQ